VHDHGALKFCKAISSTYDENSNYHENHNAKKEEKRVLGHYFLK
jgi:hypothetical protein